MFWYTSHQPLALPHPMGHWSSKVFDDGLLVVVLESSPFAGRTLPAGRRPCGWCSGIVVEVGGGCGIHDIISKLLKLFYSTAYSCC